MRNNYEVAQAIGLVNLSDPGFTVHQQKTLRAIQYCRTAALGGHIDACDTCGSISISYNSCRNRHCPKCQGHKREEWIQNWQAELLPCTYYHVVFTLPQELNPLALHRPDAVYAALFTAAWQTLDAFGKKEGLQLGMIAVLHTWGQNLALHPHLHCIVPGGGIDADGKWKRKLRSDKYLFAVKALSKVFRAKYVAGLRRMDLGDKGLLDSLFKKDWVVYAKRPFGGPQQVIGYLGRYTHKVAIGNSRLVEVNAKEATFRYKDYRHNGLNKLMVLPSSEFVRRFALHILPRRFVRIRHYGILSSSWKRNRLKDLRDSLKMVTLDKKPITLLRKCPCCKMGNLLTIEVFDKRGPPSSDLLVTKSRPGIIN
jgi:hypothetical protein